MQVNLLSKLIIPGDPIYHETIGRLPPDWQNSAEDNTIYCAGIGGILRPININSESFNEYLDEEWDARMQESDEWEDLENMILEPAQIEALANQLFPAS
jgi:hypothetical protein